MFTDLTLATITQTEVDEATAILIGVINSSEQYKNLDLNPGTVLHDLLLRPSAEILAMAIKQLQRLESTKSLQAMLASGATISADSVNDVLSNFGVTLYGGSKASGRIMIKVNKDKEYAISTNAEFTDSSGRRFLATGVVIANRNPGPDEVMLYPMIDGNFYFLVPVIAASFGTDYLLTQGTRVNMTAPMYNYISSEAYDNFTGADPAATVQDAINKLPYAISTRTLDSAASIQAILTDPNFGNFTTIQDMSTIGAGDPGQLRDKHNAFGVSLFGRVDIYPRTFITPQIAVLNKTGKRVSPGVYEFEISQSDAPAFYAIRSITDAESVIAPMFDFNTIVAVGSYRFVDVRSASGIENTFHDISPSNSVIETAYTVYQKAHVTVYDVFTAPSEDHPFKVELYYAPSIADIQAYVDKADVKSVKADILVRSPLMCVTGLRMKVEANSTSQVTAAELRDKLVAYVNKRNFVNKLTQSELVGVAYTSDIRTIDLSNDPIVGFRLDGQIRAADGTIKGLYGPNLYIDNVADQSKLVTPRTCVFCLDPNYVFINLIKI